MKKNKNKSSVKMEVISPEKAKHMLNVMVDNRPLSKSVVSRYAKEMKQGRWIYDNGDTISISNGNIIDGQHRLAACVESEIPFQVYVVTNVDKNTFTHKDIGKTRTGSDSLAVMGYSNCTKLAAAARIVNQYETGKRLGTSGRISNEGVLLTVERNPELDLWVRLSEKYRKDLLVPGGLVAGMFYLFSLSNKEMAYLFLDEFAVGENIKKGNPAKTLRDTYIRALRSPGSSPFIGSEGRSYIAESMTIAWNAYVKGLELKLIRVTNNKKITIH